MALTLRGNNIITSRLVRSTDCLIKFYCAAIYTYNVLILMRLHLMIYVNVSGVLASVRIIIDI